MILGAQMPLSRASVSSTSRGCLLDAGDTGVVVRAVFVFEGNDHSIYPSLGDAAASVEAIDVRNDEFDFFADDGTVLRGETDRGQVQLYPTADRRPGELHERLRQYLSHPGVQLDARLADEPLAAAQAILDAEWQKRPYRWFPWLDKRVNGLSGPRVR